ncbi:MAG: hypothetical protein RR338_02095 [Clostridia bacterium]
MVFNFSILEREKYVYKLALKEIFTYPSRHEVPPNSAILRKTVIFGVRQGNKSPTDRSILKCM